MYTDHLPSDRLMAAARRRAVELRREAMNDFWDVLAALLRRGVHRVAHGPWRVRKSRGDSAPPCQSPRRADLARASSAV